MADEAIELIADGGFRAIIRPEDWPIVGRTARVTRERSPSSWAGTVEAFVPSQRVLAEWHLRSGAKRSATLYSDQRRSIGGTFKITNGRHEWKAVVLEVEPAARVAIYYQIQSGAKRRRHFYVAKEVRSYVVERPDGAAEVSVFE